MVIVIGMIAKQWYDDGGGDDGSGVRFANF